MDDINRYRNHSGWRAYKALKGNSGVLRYAYGDDFILIVFRKADEVYVYNHQVTGKSEVETMKRMAASGIDLSTFIAQNVHDKYAHKRPFDFFMTAET
jgi:hypothetical protein